MKTITEVRNAFWDVHREFKSEFRKTYRQDQYKTDIRCAFVDYVDSLRKNGGISEKLARRVTL
jgi:hypothetical protein